jgi:hypothetical protein
MEKLTYTMTPKQIWEKACEHDNIPADSQFVCFSDDNPWANEYNKAMRLVQAYLKS